MVGTTARKCPGNCRWSPRSKSRSRSLGRHEASGLASAKQSAQQLASCPATHPRSIRLNYRATAENKLSSVRAMSSQQPGNGWDVSGQRLGNVHTIATLQSAWCPAMSANPLSPCPCPVRESTMTAIHPWPCPVHDRAQSASMLHPRKLQICPRRFPAVVRAGPCGRLTPLISFRQPTAHAKTGSNTTFFRVLTGYSTSAFKNASFGSE
jgi:hypothetical protein